MQIVDLNLASRPFRNNVLIWTAYGALALVLGAFTTWNVRSYIEGSRNLSELKARMGSYEQRMTELDARDAKAVAAIQLVDIKGLNIRARRANEVLQRKALSWTRLFNLLETVVPYEVKMTSIRPVYRRAEDVLDRSVPLPEGAIPVSVQGTAQSVAAFLDLERQLIRDPHFDRVEPDRSTLDPNGEVVFDLRFLYFPEGKPGEAPEDAVALPGTEEAQAPPAAVESVDAVEEAAGMGRERRGGSN